MRALVGVVLVIIGVLCLVVGVLYITQSAHSLPTFLPGYVAHATTAKHTKRGIAALVVGGVVAIVGLIVAFTGGRRYRW